jgi:hypothetical protein
MQGNFSHFFLDILYGQYEPKAQEKEQEKRKEPHQLWDPLGRPDSSKANANCNRLDHYAAQIKNQPNKLRSVNIIIGVIIFSLLIFFFMFPILGSFVIFFAFIAIVIIIAINASVQSLKIDLVKGEIAKQKQWLYDPSPDVFKGNELSRAYPDLFQAGHRRFVEDQFWGEKSINKGHYQFYTGLYHFFIEHRDSKGRRHETEHLRYFFAIHLKKKAHADFLLYPENAFSKIGNFFTKKEINVESSLFNKYFAFKYNGQKGEKALHIVQSLSPAVQAELVTLAKQYKGLSVLFKEDTVFFMFKNRLLRNVKTEVTNGLEISEEDVQFFTENLDRFISTSSNVAYYL